MDKLKERINKILRKYAGEKVDICNELFLTIVNSGLNKDEQIEAFQYVCGMYGVVESDESIQADSAPFVSEVSSLQKRYGNLLNSILETYLQENPDNEAFYSSIWNAIMESTIFDDLNKKGFAFYYILQDVHIPYFKLDLAEKYSMSNEKYRELRKKYFREIQKINFILKSPFNQRTERASTILAQIGIPVPTEEAAGKEIEEYEKKLIQMVEIMSDKEELLKVLLDKLGKAE